MFHPYDILLKARVRQTRRHFLKAWREAKPMAVVIGIFILFYWGFFTWICFEGIHFLVSGLPALGELLLGRILFIVFGLIFLMLVTSSAIMSYGVFYRNTETHWLLSLPLSHGAIFRWKFLEMAFLASWAFVFLSGPLFLAYALALRLSPFFLLGSSLVYLPFCVLANLCGCGLLLGLVRLWHLPLGRPLILALSGGLLIFVITSWKPIEVGALQETQIAPLLDNMLRNTAFLSSPYVPSYWIATSMKALGEGLWAKSGFYFTLMLSYVLAAGWLLLRFAGGLFHQNYSSVQDRALHTRKAARERGSIRFMLSCLPVRGMFWLKRPLRAILIKDLVTFLRDPSQWSQFAIFFGILGFYFLNIKNLRYRLDEPFWISVVAFLNLGSLSLILSTLTTRFVFPQFSMEGRRLWLLGLAPIRLKEVIWAKFWLSACASCVITLGLMAVSFHSLPLERGFKSIISFSVILMSLGLSGIAVGIGVLFPNLKQNNPAQIVSGVGGTFCLVLSLAYLSITVLACAIPVHMRHMAGLPLDFKFDSPVALIYTLIILVTLFAVIAPMKLAERRLERLEI